jgi:hypothetical protein
LDTRAVDPPELFDHRQFTVENPLNAVAERCLTHSFAAGDFFAIEGVFWHLADGTETKAAIAARWGVTVAALERDSFEKARLLEMSKALLHRSKVPLTVERITQVIGVDDPKRSDRGERLTLLAVQLIATLPVAHELAVWATRQVEMATEGTPAVIIAVATDSRTTLALEGVAPAAPVVVPRVVAIEHGSLAIPRNRGVAIRKASME